VVVGQDPLDDHAPGPEPGVGPSPERGGGAASLVGEDLGVGEAAVVVDGGVKVGVADPSVPPAATSGGSPAMDLVAPAVGDPPEFLHVDVDEFPGPGPLVASDRLGGLTIDVIETVEVVAAQHPVDGGRRQVEVYRQAVRPDFFGPTPAADLGLNPVGHPGRETTGSARPVVQPVGAELQVAVPPLGGTAPRDSHGRRHMSDRRPGLDPPTEQQSTLRRERSVTVTHRDLRVVSKPSTAAHLLPEVSSVVDPYRVTNVRGKNN
jgi:hypothetical protein